MLDALTKNNTWEIACRENILPHRNILNGRYFLAIEIEGTNKELCKPGFVIQGYKDAMKQPLVHRTSVPRVLSSKIMVAPAAIFSSQPYSYDVIQVYLQSSEHLMIKQISEFAHENKS